jgi:TolB protein
MGGGDIVPVPVDGEYYAFSPTWSSTGFIAYRGSRGLYVTSMDKDAQASVVGNTPRPDSPAWSPDGSRLAFMMWQNDHWDIFTMNPDGSYRKILTPPPAFLKRVYNNVAPAWSPDGKRLAFLSDREGVDNWHIYVMNADGSDQHAPLDVAVRYDAASERVLSWSR